MGKRGSIIVKGGVAAAVAGAVAGFAFVASHQQAADCQTSSYVLHCGGFLSSLAYPLQNFPRVLGAAAGALPGIIIALSAAVRAHPTPERGSEAEELKEG